MLNDIYQGLDPIAFSLGPLVVRWYGLAYVLGFVCAAAIIYFVAKRWKLGMSEDNLLTLMVCAIVGVVLGALAGFFGGIADKLLTEVTNIFLMIPSFFLILIVVAIGAAIGAFNGFFVAKFKLHPFIVTLATQLILYTMLLLYVKMGNNNGMAISGLDEGYRNFVVGNPPLLNFAGGAIQIPNYVIYAILLSVLMWFIWNKTTFGKNLFAVGGNAEAAAVSGISVFRVTVGAFILAGILYGFGSWLECIRMVGSGSAAYGQGWEMDAIAACVVGGVSFTGGIGKISGVVVGVFIFTALTYSLTTLGIDTNLQFVFSGIIILVAVMLDCLKYVQKK